MIKRKVVGIFNNARSSSGLADFSHRAIKADPFLRSTTSSPTRTGPEGDRSKGLKMRMRSQIKVRGLGCSTHDAERVRRWKLERHDLKKINERKSIHLHNII